MQAEINMLNTLSGLRSFQENIDQLSKKYTDELSRSISISLILDVEGILIKTSAYGNKAPFNMVIVWDELLLCEDRLHAFLNIRMKEFEKRWRRAWMLP